MTEDNESARPTDVAGGPEASDWGYRAVTWSIAFAALGYLVFSLWGGWRDVAAAAGKAG